MNFFSRTSRTIQPIAIALALSLTPIKNYALNPIQGWYGGVFLGGNYSPNISRTVPYPFPGELYDQPVKETLSYSILGDIGGQIGYRACNFRAEGEFLYNYIPYNGLNIGPIFLTGTSTSGTTTPIYQNGNITAGKLQFQGSTSTYAWFLNGYYDLFYNNYTDSMVPFVGGGIGYGLFQNWIQFLYENNDLSNANVTKNSSALVYQGIIGLNYFLDDYTAFGLDARYITGTDTTVTTYRSSFKITPTIVTLNVSFNGSFNL
jgi:hypothetical protein